MKLYNIPKRARVLIFDIDSTLYTCPEYAHEQIDSQVRHYAALHNLSADGARKMVADFRRKWAAEHDGKKISLGNLLTFFGVSIETSIEWRKTLFDPAAFLHRDEALIAALSELQKSFYLVCVTNNPVDPARRTLDVLGIAGMIPDIVGLDTCMASKPSRKVLDAAMAFAARRLGAPVAPADCVSVGDRYDIDLALPLSLGMGGVLVDGVEDVYQLSKVLVSATL